MCSQASSGEPPRTTDAAQDARQAAAPFYVVTDDREVLRFDSFDSVMDTGIEAIDIDEYEFWDSLGHRLIATRAGDNELAVVLRLDERTPPDLGALADRIRTHVQRPPQFPEVEALLTHRSQDPDDLRELFDCHAQCVERWREERRIRNRLRRVVRRARRQQ